MLSRAARNFVGLHSRAGTSSVWESRGKCCTGLLPFFPCFPYGCLLLSHFGFPDNFPWYLIPTLDGPSVWELLWCRNPVQYRLFCEQVLSVSQLQNTWVSPMFKYLPSSCSLSCEHILLAQLSQNKEKTCFGIVHSSGGSSCIPEGRGEGRRFNEWKTKLWRRRRKLFLEFSLWYSPQSL